MVEIQRWFERLRRSGLARNAGWMLCAQGLNLGIQLAYFVVIARLLGSREYGVLMGAAAMTGIVGQYATLGSGMVLLRYVSGDRGVFREYWGNALVTTALAGSAVALGLTLGGRWLVGAESAALIGVLAMGDCVFARLSECAGQAFQAIEELRATAGLLTLTSLLRLGAAVGLFVTVNRTQAREWAWASLLVSMAAAIVAVTAVSVRMGAPRLLPGLLWRRAAEGFGFAVAYSTTSIYNDVDKAMLSRYGMEQANGTYSIAYRVVDIGCVPIRSAHAAALPRFFRTPQAKGVDRRLMRRVLAGTSSYAVLVGVGMFVAAPLLPRLAGMGFAESVVTLRWLCLLPLLRSLHLCAGDAITGAGKQRFRTGSQFVAAAVNVGINVLLIPRFGWRGAAMASLLTDGLLAAGNWAVVWWLGRSAALRTVIAARMEA